jgi:mono/diheme cytochrome c family protein
VNGRRLLILAVSFVATAVSAACNRMPGVPKKAAVEVRPDRVESFEVLYAANCAACHGPNGIATGSALGLANPVYLAIAGDDVLRRATSEGVAGTPMPAFARTSGGALTDAQIGVLVAGIRSWATPLPAGEPPPPYAGGPGNAPRGESAYAAACASCHGAGGAGGPKAGSIVDGSYLGLVSDQNLRTTIIAGRPDIGHPDWRGDGGGRALTSQDVSDLVAWLAALRPATPGEPYPRRNP